MDSRNAVLGRTKPRRVGVGVEKSRKSSEPPGGSIARERRGNVAKRPPSLRNSQKRSGEDQRPAGRS